MTRRARGWTIAALVAAVAVLVGSVAWAIGGGLSAGTSTSQVAPWQGRDASGSSADLPGTVVDVVAMDMGGRGMMGNRRWGMGTMRLRPDRADVPAGTVTLRLDNVGTVDHELVVLPLPAGQQVGRRTVGPDGTVDESASLGEASATDAAGAGDGIAPGASGWVTLDLRPGRYELVCNIEGHYAAGMYALLVVT
ncbi:sulfocyanin-like copper-binding protein [Isoptericola sp. b441]|uniref:Sulfocyanin-like copper-binding protein n=1 Tax=Actinotalea lenta TaxID=3064654 RepID=A0ABT9D4U2_9CELL|nr:MULTISPECIES: sulfocyanin-like copper-binding protein [unclassified Isoptericola]MDO8105678.1 sulfocyanin-like copper-binding protein [Isoptericola sp. b441]MDO8122383.1 sulfocyanin-like copper-binding protein [Isoptericola sp. b490]